MRQVLTDEGEFAVALLGTAMGALRTELRCESMASFLRRPRLATRAVPSHRTYLFQSALLRLVSITEEFARTSLSRSVEQRLPADEAMVEKLWERAARDVDLGWRQQFQAWNDWFKLDVEKATSYKEFSPFIQARNAVVHGLGYLTRTQLAKDRGRSVRDQLRRAGIQCNGNFVDLDLEAIETCAKRSRDFVNWLDHECQRLGRA